ncbi:hypothetical protein [Amycolatopsis sp. NPDC051372]
MRSSESRLVSKTDYRASYDLHWMVEDGSIVGLRFTHCGDGSQFPGRHA